MKIIICKLTCYKLSSRLIDSVWNEIASELAHLRLVWAEEQKEVTSVLKGLSQKMFGQLAKKTGWEYAKDEGFLTSLLRTLAITVAGKSDDPAVVAEAKKRFADFIGGKEDAIHPNLRGAVFQIALRNGGTAEYEKVLQLYKDTTIADQKVIALGSLGATLQPELLKRTLELGMSEDVRPQDIIYVFAPVAANPVGRTMAWEFVKEKWQTLYDRYYSGSMSLLGRIVSSTTEDFASNKHYEDVEKFFSKRL
jgi:aminopeptidase 2